MQEKDKLMTSPQETGMPLSPGRDGVAACDAVG
jgi:hypothetical protein